MELMKEFPEELLWQRPADIASPGFHLQHLSGVLDRLFTYAKGESLNKVQLEALACESDGRNGANTWHSDEIIRPNLAELLERFDRQVNLAIHQLETTSEEELIQARGVGRAKIPSTVLGLLFHGAEHTQRHNGQLLVTVKVLLGEKYRSGNLPGKGGV
jgi:hypothetical protein